MKITKRDLGVLMILIGVLVAFLTYQMSFKSTMEEVEKLQKEQKSLSNQIKELQPIKDKSEFYISEMARYETEIKEIVNKFPVDIWYEDGIMYIVEMSADITDTMEKKAEEETTPVKPTTKPSTKPAAEEEEEEIPVINIPNLTITPASVISSVGDDTKKYDLLKATEQFTYTVKDYDTLKELLAYIYKTGENKNNITSVAMLFDKSEGSISGSISISLFAMKDGERTYSPVELDLDKLGVANIFGKVEIKEDTDK